jgi:hypothetical protein
MTARTPTERELLAECERQAAETGALLRAVLADAVTYWHGAGRSVEPRRWRSRADAAQRLLDRMPDPEGDLAAWAAAPVGAY